LHRDDGRRGPAHKQQHGTMATTTLVTRGTASAPAVVLGLVMVAALGIVTNPPLYCQRSRGSGSSTCAWLRESRVTARTTSAATEEATAGLVDPTILAVNEPNSKDTGPAAAAPSSDFVLDFAIVGYPKTATSFLLGWLAQHQQVLARTSEMYQLQQGRVGDFVASMKELGPPMTAASNASNADPYRRGYKAPRDIENPVAMGELRTHWPEAKLIVGLRHPVLWFESFYNFRIRHKYSMAAPNSTEFLRQPTCIPAWTHGVCVADSRFHVPLSRLGKTPMTSPHELQLLGMDDDDANRSRHRRRPSRHRLFLYEMSQVYESTKPVPEGANLSDAQRAEQFRDDLANFLGLSSPLSSTYSEPGHYLPNRSQAMRICDVEHSDLRRHLMKNARDASTWIREYLLVHSGGSSDGDVVVSSPQHFDSLLRTWLVDPCSHSGSRKERI
jgi:hypothetical protein